MVCVGRMVGTWCVWVGWWVHSVCGYRMVGTWCVWVIIIIIIINLYFLQTRYNFNSEARKDDIKGHHIIVPVH